MLVEVRDDLQLLIEGRLSAMSLILGSDAHLAVDE